MAMGTRKDREEQEELWVPHTALPKGASHPFYQRLNQLLEKSHFDEFVEGRCQRFYAKKRGRPSLVSGGVFPAAADRVFRRDRFGAWDRLAGAGLAGAAALSPGRTGGVAAGSFDDLADAAADGGGDASCSQRTGACGGSRATNAIVRRVG